MRKCPKAIASVLLACMLVGCMSTPAGLTSSTLPITSRDTYTVIAKDVTGADWGLSVFGISIVPMSAYNAIQRAKEQYGADGMINVAANNSTYWLLLILPLVNYHRIELTGDAIKLRRSGMMAE